MRTVTIRYLVPVYATVDIDAPYEWETTYDGKRYKHYGEAGVTKVFLADESIIRGDHLDICPELTAPDPIETSYDEDAIDPTTLTPGERKRALYIAENSLWPIWESG